MNEKFRNNIKSQDNTKQFQVNKTQCQSLLIFDRQKYCTVSMQVRFVTKYLPKIQVKTTSDNEYAIQKMMKAAENKIIS